MVLSYFYICRILCVGVITTAPHKHDGNVSVNGSKTPCGVVFIYLHNDTVQINYLRKVRMDKVIHTNFKDKGLNCLGLYITLAAFVVECIITVALAFPASAITYETGTNVQFTFNPALSLSVSGDLLISDLSPNTASDSNIITVNIKTNNISGYNLYATTGNTTYDTTELTNTTFAASSAPKFASLNTTDSIDTLSNFSPNTWGYSYSNNDGTTWTSYSGLPLYTNAGTVISSSTAAAENTTKFKIAASAAATQTAGDYQNVVNFYAVTNKAPVSFFDAFASAGKEMYNGYYKMQDMTSSICAAVETSGEDSQTKLIDIRDNNTYWIAKLDDNNCWMTQNLNFAPLVTETYTYYDTDLGHTNNNTSEEWTPLEETMSRPAYVVNFTTGVAANPVAGWDSSDNRNNQPKYAEGVNYVNGVPTQDEVIMLNGTRYLSINECLQDGKNISDCEHYQIGNYYNWSAAIADNNSSEFVNDYQMAPNSVCPAGWKLPHGLELNDEAIVAADYNTLLFLGGITLNIDLEGNVRTQYSSNGFTAINSAPYYFARSSSIHSSGLYDFGWEGYYWTSTAKTDETAYCLLYNEREIMPAQNNLRFVGRSVRCLAR